MISVSGNVFVLYTDKNGNKSYIPYAQANMLNAAAARSNSTTAQNATFVNANGEFVTTADPNTLGGGLALSTLSLDQLGTSAFNNTGSFANNVVNTTGDLAGGALNLAGNALGDVTSLAKGAGNGLMQLGSSNGYNNSSSNGPNGPNVSNGSSSVYGSVGGGAVTGYTPNTSVSGKNFGNIQGQTQIDNYSYYGALQSKGGNYMPITADFSSFRK